MASKKNEKEYDPEKDKDIKKGPLKPKHVNQNSKNDGGEDRELPKRAAPKKGEEREDK